MFYYICVGCPLVSVDTCMLTYTHMNMCFRTCAHTYAYTQMMGGSAGDRDAGLREKGGGFLEEVEIVFGLTMRR